MPHQGFAGRPERDQPSSVTGVASAPDGVVYGVFDPADLIMGSPTDSDELLSLWSSEALADAEARRLEALEGWRFVVHRLTVYRSAEEREGEV